MNQILHGNILEIAPTLPAQSVHCIVTSPPYYGLRDYGADGQIGLESTPEEYIAKMVALFGELRRVLRDDGTLWLNLGDSYTAGVGSRNGTNLSGLKKNVKNEETRQRLLVENKIYRGDSFKEIVTGLPPKNLLGIPWRVALALQADGWYLRSDIIWAKPNPMPESVTDRPTKAHEYIFLLSKSERYYYDAEAIKETSSPESLARLLRGVSDNRKNINGAPGQLPHSMNQPRPNRRSAADSFKRDGSKREQTIPGQGYGTHRPDRAESEWDTSTRNKRTVWTVATQPYSGAHFATFPPKLIEPCILAGCPVGGVVLDPFFGSGTVGQVAIETGRQWLGVELNPEYIKLANQRIAAAQPALIAPSGAVPPNNDLHATQQSQLFTKD